MLPLGPPDDVGSPYASSSAFAAWSGFLAEPDAPVSDAEVAAYRDRQRFWAADWEAAGGTLDDQVRFEREWSSLRAYARERGVRLIGDVPIYVAWDSVDHRSHPELFLDGVVAGAPPDDLGPEGQHWGNPLFDWAGARARAATAGGSSGCGGRSSSSTSPGSTTSAASRRSGRSRRAETDARTGRWLPGPGEAPFRAAERELGPLPVIAEDLGLITRDVVELRDRLGFPGMAVMLWAFKGAREQPAPAREPPRAAGRLHLHPRHRDARRRLPQTAIPGS